MACNSTPTPSGFTTLAAAAAGFSYVGMMRSPRGPHLTPTLSAPKGGEGAQFSTGYDHRDAAARRGDLFLDGKRLETAWWGPAPGAAPTLVLLHEGLGSVALWRDFPEALVAATGCGVFAYSRFGYGASDPVNLPRPMTYMHDEALNVLPRVLDAAGVRRAALIGHSDGGSIAAIHAGGVHDPRIAGLVLIAAHFFVEDINIASIARIKANYEQGDLRQRLARYHRDVDVAFRGWNDAWLDPRFRAFDITDHVGADPGAGSGVAGRRRSLRHTRAASRAGTRGIVPSRDAPDCRRPSRAPSGSEGRDTGSDRAVRAERPGGTSGMKRIDFETDPGRYRHWRLAFDGPVATLTMDVDPDGGLFEGCELKLNSYDLGVDIELADAVQRLRFEHPEVRTVVLRSGKEGVFCAGANIRMLGKASHGHKVNFCKFTNETRLAIEDASANSGSALAGRGERQRGRRRV